MFGRSAARADRIFLSYVAVANVGAVLVLIARWIEKHFNY